MCPGSPIVAVSPDGELLTKRIEASTVACGSELGSVVRRLDLEAGLRRAGVSPGQRPPELVRDSIENIVR